VLKIDPSDYLLAVENAETALELAGQEIGAGTHRFLPRRQKWWKRRPMSNI